MKKTRHPLSKMTGPDTTHSPNSTSTAYFLSKYAAKQLLRAIDGLQESGFTIEHTSAGPVLINRYGLRKQLSSLSDVYEFVGVCA